MNLSLLQELAKAALAAPSADNRHRFRLKPLAGDTVLLSDETGLMAAPAHRRFLTLISLGAVVENMSLRAAQLGHDLFVQWHPAEHPAAVAILTIASRPAPANDLDLATQIDSRHTNRRMFRGPSLTDIERVSLGSAAAVDGVKLEWLEGPRRRAVQRLAWIAESERFLQRGLHQELFNAIRFDLGWHQTTPEGLPPGALEVEAPMRPLFKTLRSWPLMRVLTWLGMHRALGFRAGLLPCMQAPALVLLSSPLPIDEAACAGGRALERLWLRASLGGLALQPLAASSVLQLQADMQDGASARLRQALNAGWSALLGEAHPLMVCRVGRADSPTVRTSRPDSSQVLEG